MLAKRAPSRSMKNVSSRARINPAMTSATSAAPSSTAPSLSRRRASTRSPVRSRRRSTVSRDTSKGPSSTTQSSTSSIASVSVGPSDSVSSATDGAIAADTPASTMKNANNEATAARPAGQRCRRSHSEIGARIRLKNRATTIGITTARMRLNSHSAATATTPMPISRQLYAPSRSTTGCTRRLAGRRSGSATAVRRATGNRQVISSEHAHIEYPTPSQAKRSATTAP